MKVSKEFIAMFEGVSKGEKWTRKHWKNKEVTIKQTREAKIIQDRTGQSVSDFVFRITEKGRKNFVTSRWSIKPNDVFAEDWIKIN